MDGTNCRRKTGFVSDVKQKLGVTAVHRDKHPEKADAPVVLMDNLSFENLIAWSVSDKI